MKYFLFINVFEGSVKVKASNNLDEFKDFCHYCELSDWESTKKYINKCIEKSGRYIFDGNDSHYYILTHPTWRSFDFEDGIEVKVIE